MQISQVSVRKTKAQSPKPTKMPWHVAHIPMPPLFSGKGTSCRRAPSIKANQDITPDPGREVDFGLKVELDAHRERGISEIAFVVDGSFEKVSCERVVCVSVRKGWWHDEGGRKQRRVRGLLYQRSCLGCRRGQAWGGGGVGSVRACCRFHQRRNWPGAGCRCLSPARACRMRELWASLLR